MQAMDEQEQARQALKTMFRHDQVEAPKRVARQRRKRMKPTTLAWLIGIVVVVLALAPIAFIVIYPRLGPLDTMTAFCQAENVGEYQRAYAMLSPRAQAHVSLDTFSRNSDQANVVACELSGGVPFIFNQTQVTFNSVDIQTSGGANGGEVVGTISFVKVNGEWRIDAMSPDLFGLTS